MGLKKYIFEIPPKKYLLSRAIGVAKDLIVKLLKKKIAVRDLARKLNIRMAP